MLTFVPDSLSLSLSLSLDIYKGINISLSFSLSSSYTLTHTLTHTHTHSDIDFESLAAGRIIPPWTPTVVGSMDTSQFDMEFTSMLPVGKH